MMVISRLHEEFEGLAVCSALAFQRSNIELSGQDIASQLSNDC